MYSFQRIVGFWLQEELGYDLEWNFERGIKVAFEWYKENL